MFSYVYRLPVECYRVVRLFMAAFHMFCRLVGVFGEQLGDFIVVLVNQIKLILLHWMIKVSINDFKV